MARRRENVADELEAEGVPGLDDSDPSVEGQIPPHDHPHGASEYGVTAREHATDEPVTERRLREQPDVGSDRAENEPAEGAMGRVVAPDEGDLYFDTEKDEVASVAGDDVALSAEEEAVHETDTP